MVGPRGSRTKFLDTFLIIITIQISVYQNFFFQLSCDNLYFSPFSFIDYEEASGSSLITHLTCIFYRALQFYKITDKPNPSFTDLVNLHKSKLSIITIFFKSIHHYCLNSLLWLVVQYRYVIKSLGDKCTNKSSASPRFLDKIAPLGSGTSSSARQIKQQPLNLIFCSPSFFFH